MRRLHSDGMRLRMQAGKRHMFIPDGQVRKGVPTRHFEWAAYYLIDMQPDVLVFAGDHWDMPSLSRWSSKARKAWDRTTYSDDVQSGEEAMERFASVLDKRGAWSAIKRKEFTLGNHDVRADRVIEEDPGMAEFISVERDIVKPLKARGFNVHPFRQPVTIDGVSYAHLFDVGTNGRTSKSGQNNGSSSAKAQVQGMLRSCTAGHRQGLDTYIHQTPEGLKRGVIAGSYYLHDESYVGPSSSNTYWRGLLIKNDVRNGDYDLLEVSAHYLARKYGHLTKGGKP